MNDVADKMLRIHAPMNAACFLPWNYVSNIYSGFPHFIKKERLVCTRMGNEETPFSLCLGIFFGSLTVVAEATITKCCTCPSIDIL